MDDPQNTIGLADLLAEIDRDLDEFRRKHQTDYGVKNVTLWWELEKDRLTIRHGPALSVRKRQRLRGTRRWVALFLAGWLSVLALNVALRLLVP
jgi:hypothetical protein